MDEPVVTQITRVEWGKMDVTIGGRVQHFKDCKVWPGGAVSWNWKESGTSHQPGVQPADLGVILDQEVDVLILGCGVLERLGICAETLNLLEERKIELHFLDTRRAASLYNELARTGRRVGGIFHATC